MPPGSSADSTAAYLAEHLPSGLKVALAGRSRSRLGEGPRGTRRRGVGLAAGRGRRHRSRLLLTAGGRDPDRAHHRRPLRQVRVAAGAGVRRGGYRLRRSHWRSAVSSQSIDRFDDTARRTGARIVHSCGFDSIPSDLGVHALYRAAQADDAGEFTDTTLVVTAFRGGISGGTIDSLRTQLDVMRKDPALRKVAGQPHSVEPGPVA